MAEEGTLGLARAATITEDDSSSKDRLQRKMEATRESISQTVDEIKDTVVHQYEAVKETISETLDWREQVKKRPVAWTATAAGAGFILGYGITAVVKGEKSPAEYREEPKPPLPVARQVSGHGNGHAESGPGLMERFTETQAYLRLRDEAGKVGNRFVDEISKSAQQIILPAAVSLVVGWLERLLPPKDRELKQIN
jgi:ElaB/YqjD/DUF883 family membrane-anchored ribosome-binding protein